MSDEEVWFEADEPPTGPHHVMFDCGTRKTLYRLETPEETAERDKFAEAYKRAQEVDAQDKAKRDADREAAFDLLEKSDDPQMQAIAKLLRG